MSGISSILERYCPTHKYDYFLYDKDVINRPPSFDCKHEIIAVRLSDRNKAEILAEGAEAEEKWGENADLGPRGVVRFLCPCLDEMYEELLAEQAAARVLWSIGRMDSIHA